MDPDFAAGMMLRGNHPLQLEEKRRGAEFFERMREQKDEEDRRLAAETKHAKAMDALINSYADLLPESEGKALKAKNATWGAADREGYLGAQALVQQYQKMTEAKTKAAAEQRQAEDTVAVYRDLPMQPARRAMTTAVNNGVDGILDTLTQWSQPGATEATPADLRAVVAQHPYAGLDANIGRGVMRGIEDQPTAAENVTEGKTSFGVPWARAGKVIQFFPSTTAQDEGPKEDPSGNYFWNGRGWTPKKTIPEPGEKPITSPDGKFYWSGGRWVAVKTDAATELGNQLRAARGGGEATSPGVQTPAKPGTTPAQQAILDDFAAGKLSRDAAKVKLKALGLD